DRHRLTNRSKKGYVEKGVRPLLVYRVVKKGPYPFFSTNLVGLVGRVSLVGRDRSDLSAPPDLPDTPALPGRPDPALPFGEPRVHALGAPDERGVAFACLAAGGEHGADSSASGDSFTRARHV